MSNISQTPFVIAIDGPAASGKGTLARRLAKKFKFHHLDTGLTYRAVGHELMQRGLALDDEAQAVAIANSIELAGLDREILSAHEIGEAASRVAVMSSVRKALVEAQRIFSKRLPGSILDGRDIGTVVCPNANAKFFITASPGIRAGRRFEEITGRGGDATFDEILNDIRQRDERDMARQDSPLKPAADAHLIDTSKMDIETAFQAVLDIIENIRNA